MNNTAHIETKEIVTKPILEWINFGKVSAERDDKLSNYFFDNGVLKTVLEDKTSFLVLGRKGAGKTAVFKHLTENKSKFLTDNDVLVSLSFDDYNWNVHALLTNEAKADSMLYKQSWRFIILIEVIKAYSTWFEEKSKPIPKPIKSALKLLEKLFDSPIPSIGQLVGRKLLALSGLKLPSGGLDLEDGDLDSLEITAGEVTFEQVQSNKDLRQHLSENIENIINHLEDAASKNSSDWPNIFICFDRVDEAWDEVSYELSRKVIAGLVAASDAINFHYKGKVRPIVFLREDIFDALSLNDTNKLQKDCGALLHWTKPALSSLILCRVNYFSSLAKVPVVTNLDALFDKEEMRQRAKPTNYLIRRTMMRPRDLISFLDLIATSMQEQVNDPFAEDPPVFSTLSCEAVYIAETSYSEWLKREVLEEWKVQRPDIIKLFQAIQNNGYTNFTQNELSSALENIGLKVVPEDLLELLRFIFDNSIIGFKLGASTEWRYKCFYPSQGFVESDEYHVHEGLVKALNLKETREKQ